MRIDIGKRNKDGMIKIVILMSKEEYSKDKLEYNLKILKRFIVEQASSKTINGAVDKNVAK